MVPSWVAERVRAEEWQPVGRGYTRAPKWRARLRDGAFVFVKAAEDEHALPTLVRELLVYKVVRGPFLPVAYDLYADEGHALIVLEDLTEAHWPPPYPDDVTPLFLALEAVAAARPPEGLRRLEDAGESPWQAFAREPERLLSLGVCSEQWLDRALPALAEAAGRVPLSGDALVHYDVWAENMCFADRGAVLIDWAEARIGNPAIDVAFALLSLQVEGAATQAVEEEPALAAFVTGAVAAEAAAPLPSWAAPGSTLREDQLGDLRVALPWVAELLGLPVP